MYIEKSVITRKGYALNIHVIESVVATRSITFDNLTQTNSIHVCSWSSLDDYISKKSYIDKQIITLELDTNFVIDSGIFEEATNFLVTDENSKFFGGIIKTPNIEQLTLDKAKNSAWTTIKSERNNREFSTFVWNNYIFDCDPTSQSRIQGAVILAMQALSTNQPFDINWTLADNSVVTLSASDIINVGNALANNTKTLHEIAQSLRENIYNSTTVEEVQNITWPT